MALVFPLPVSTVESAVITLDPKTALGGEAKIEDLQGNVLVGEGVVVTVSEDGLSLDVISDLEQIVEIEVLADKKIGEGVEPISEVVSIAFSSAQAADLGIAFSTKPRV